MLGGALWATGNVLAVPVIKLVGLSLGLLIWGATNCVTGWLTGTFGLFGVKPDNIPRPWLNYLGLGLTLVSLSLYVLIRPASDDDEDENGLTRDGLPKES